MHWKCLIKFATKRAHRLEGLLTSWIRQMFFSWNLPTYLYIFQTLVWLSLKKKTDVLSLTKKTFIENIFSFDFSYCQVRCHF